MAFGKSVAPNVPSCLPENPSHFFKIILPSTLKAKKMGIPKKFVEKFGQDLSDVATLMVPNGSCWRVDLEKDGRNVWFCDGWHEFVESHSISFGYFLVFKYGKNSNFHVVIFDLTACEINYPYKYEESENVKWNSEFQDGLEIEDSEQIIDATTPKHPLSSLKRNHFDKCPRKRVFRERNSLPAPQNQAKDAFGSSQQIRRNCPSAMSQENSKVKHKSEPQSKKCKIEEFTGITESDNDNEYDLYASLGEMGIYFARTQRRFSAEETQRAVNIARSLKLKNPAFMIILRSSQRFHVYVPGEFANQFLSRNVKYIKLQASNGRELSLQICWGSKGGSYLTRGWAEFSKAKNLKEGDICIFELIRRKDVLLKISVFQDEGVFSKRNSLRAHQNQPKDIFRFAQRLKRNYQPASFLENSKIKHNYNYEAQSKECKTKESVEVNESDGDNEYDLFAVLGEMGICISTKSRLLSSEENKRAINAARSLKPKSPSFMVILRSSTIDFHFLYVPANFANKFVSKNAKSIEVQCSNESEYWPIGICRRPCDGFLLKKGWAEFLKKNNLNLKEGDVCIFELIRAKDVLLKLSVFHG